MERKRFLLKIEKLKSSTQKEKLLRFSEQYFNGSIDIDVSVLADRDEMLLVFVSADKTEVNLGLS